MQIPLRQLQTPDSPLGTSLLADPSLPAIRVSAASNYDGTWAKNKAAFKLIYENHKYVENSIDIDINLFQNIQERGRLVSESR